MGNQTSGPSTPHSTTEGSTIFSSSMHGLATETDRTTPRAAPSSSKALAAARGGSSFHNRNGGTAPSNTATTSTRQVLSPEDKAKYRSFPGSAFLEKALCGSIDTTDPAEYHGIPLHRRLLKKADAMCISSPPGSDDEQENGIEVEEQEENNSDDDHPLSSANMFNHHGDQDGNMNINNIIPMRTGNNNSKMKGMMNVATATQVFSRDDESAFVVTSPRRGGSDRPVHPTSALLARALVSEVTDNPKTMKPSEMAEREKKLLKAQKAALMKNNTSTTTTTSMNSSNNSSANYGHGMNNNASPARPVGVPGGIGSPHIIGSLAYACTGQDTAVDLCGPNTTTTTTTVNTNNTSMPGGGVGTGGTTTSTGNGGENWLTGNTGTDQPEPAPSPFRVTLAIMLSRHHTQVGHPDTITRQTAFDFNELQDRAYKYVSSTDARGWRAGGGEPGNNSKGTTTSSDMVNTMDPSEYQNTVPNPTSGTTNGGISPEKVAAPDMVHIPIIHIDCPNQESIDQIIHALAGGDIFIPHMSVLPEALSVNGISPPDLLVRFGCERNDDIPPDDWPNWCLEFMHNQLYEYFYTIGARWMKRPFSITLAQQVRWKTVKHMNRYFAHAEQVIDRWRQAGPQYLDPQLSYIEGGATPEEVARPHGLYLMRYGGIPTNYFAPNFEPPYTTKMTRSLLENVLNKSWDKKRREWTSHPLPRLVSPGTLLSVACGCTDPGAGGFLAKEVTTIHPSANHSNIVTMGDNYSHQTTSVSQQQQQYSPYRQYGRPIAIISREDNDEDYHAVSDQPNNAPKNKHAAGAHPGEPLQNSVEPEALHFHASMDDNDDNTSADVDKNNTNSGKVVGFTQDKSSSDRGRANNMSKHQQQKLIPQEEEKKTDDMTGIERGRGSITPGGGVMDNMEAESGYTMSIATSGTTVAHSNLTRAKAGNREKAENSNNKQVNTNQLSKQLYSDEDWHEEMAGGTPSESNTGDPPGNKPASSPNPRALKKTSVSPREALEQEMQRQKELIAKVQRETSPTMNAQVLMDREKAKSSQHYRMMANPINTGKSPRNPSPRIDQIESTMSLEYSADGSSAFFSQEGAGSSVLVGQHFLAPDPSMGESPLRRSVEEEEEYVEGDEEYDHQTASGDLSIQESASIMSVVPTDEELFAVGWAKALDPNSGNYYYFTLDRTTTVWDNPISSFGELRYQSIDAP